jgi:Cu/Ag efflux protein CusF
MKPVFPILLLGLALSLPAAAASHEAAMPMQLAAADRHHASAEELSSGTVKKVNGAQGTLTIRHGPMKNLDMPAMTMNFRVTKPVWLDRVKPGDRLRFHAEMADGQLTITRLEIIH